VRFGFETLGLERIIALADPQNIASRRVMEKAGLSYQREVFFFGMKLVYYQIELGEYRADDAIYRENLLLHDNGLKLK
jgi:ribosomal-protein-alanine N-acetyltransferase